MSKVTYYIVLSAFIFFAFIALLTGNFTVSMILGATGIFVYIIHNKMIEDEIEEKRMEKLIDQHIKVLVRKKKQLLTVNDYGIENHDDWIKELKYFMKTILFEGNRETTLEDSPLVELIEKKIYTYALNNPSNFDETMSPIEYEHYCADILKDNGWITRVTQASGDQGVDVIASKNGKTLALQCKMYASAVGNKAVQEVFSAKEHIGADYAAVVTNNTYTKSAIELANTTGVFLLHHDDLKDLNPSNSTGLII